MKIDFSFRFAIIVFLVSAAFFVWGLVFYNESADTLKVYFLDVGQGDATFIETPNGNQILIDAGMRKEVMMELSKIMGPYDRSIDIIIATHPDADHIGGFINVLDKYSVEILLENDIGEEDLLYKKFIELVDERDIKRLQARRGTVLSLDKDINLFVLFPDRDIVGLDSNDASLFLKLSYGEHDFLFTGDLTKKIEEYVAFLDDKFLESEVLHVGHHGSKTSTSEVFVEKVLPDYAVISYGKDNSYGHPHKETVEILNRFNVKILETAERGTILFESDGETLTVF